MKTKINLFPHIEESHKADLHQILFQKLTRYNDRCVIDDESRLCEEISQYSIDALVYASIEYTQYSRPHSEKERLEYLLHKCKEFFEFGKCRRIPKDALTFMRCDIIKEQA